MVFLDADGVLLPEFIATHIFIHLSLRIPVGFTSADVLQTVESRIVFGTYFTLSEYVRSGRGKRSDLLRRIDESACDLWPLHRPEASIESQVHLVEPGDITGWYWAPMSANCFRRDALRLFLLDEELAKLRGSLDGFLLRALSLVVGSVLIDRPLSIYRLHGSNSYKRSGPSDRNALVCKMISDYMISKAKLFLSKMYSAEQYIDTLAALDDEMGLLADVSAL